MRMNMKNNDIMKNGIKYLLIGLAACSSFQACDFDDAAYVPTVELGAPQD